MAFGCMLAGIPNIFRQSCGRFHNLQIYIGAASMIMIINLDVLQKSFILANRSQREMELA